VVYENNRDRIFASGHNAVWLRPTGFESYCNFFIRNVASTCFTGQLSVLVLAFLLEILLHIYMLLNRFTRANRPK